jgi:hypothetical protein
MLFRSPEELNRAARQRHVSKKMGPNTNSELVKNLASLMSYMGKGNDRKNKINNFIKTYRTSPNIRNKINLLIKNSKAKKINLSRNNYKSYIIAENLYKNYGSKDKSNKNEVLPLLRRLAKQYLDRGMNSESVLSSLPSILPVMNKNSIQGMLPNKNNSTIKNILNNPKTYFYIMSGNLEGKLKELLEALGGDRETLKKFLINRKSKQAQITTETLNAAIMNVKNGEKIVNNTPTKNLPPNTYGNKHALIIIGKFGNESTNILKKLHDLYKNLSQQNRNIAMAKFVEHYKNKSKEDFKNALGITKLPNLKPRSAPTKTPLPPIKPNLVVPKAKKSTQPINNGFNMKKHIMLKLKGIIDQDNLTRYRRANKIFAIVRSESNNTKKQKAEKIINTYGTNPKFSEILNNLYNRKGKINWSSMGKTYAAPAPTKQNMNNKVNKLIKQYLPFYRKISPLRRLQLRQWITNTNASGFTRSVNQYRQTINAKYPKRGILGPTNTQRLFLFINKETPKTVKLFQGEKPPPTSYHNKFQVVRY